MRRAGWEDFALPLTLVFAVVFALTLRQEISFSPAEAMAGTQRPDYVMTITAKRLPSDCRNAATRTAACSGALAGEARVEMWEGNTRLADRSMDSVFAY